MHMSISSLDALSSPAPSHRGASSSSGLGGLMSSPSLVPRHDYIPSGLHSLRSRLPPAASPVLPARSLSVGAAASPISKPIFSSLVAAAAPTAAATPAGSGATAAITDSAPLPLDAATVASSLLRSTHALIPIQTPASFIPPSPTPVASPFKSILRRHLSTPSASAQTVPTPSPSGHGKAHVPVRLFQTADASPTGGADTAMSAAAAAPAGAAATDGAPAVGTHTRRGSLRPLAARTESQFLAELAEMHHTLNENKQPSPEHPGNGYGSSNSNGSPSPSRAKRPRLEASSAAAAAAAASPTSDQKGAAAAGDSVGSGSLMLTPPARHTRRSSLLSSAAASPCHSRQGSASHQPQSHGKARVRFDRAVILEFGLVPDASKVRRQTLQ